MVFLLDINWAWAQSVLQLQLPDVPVPVVLAHNQNQSAQESLQRFIKKQDTSKGFQLLETTGRPEWEKAKADVIDLSKSQKPLVLLIANDPSDLVRDSSERMLNLIHLYQSSGWDVKMVSYFPTLHASPKDKSSFYQSISKNARILYALGGDDISPRAYGQKNRHSIHTNYERDKQELELVKSFKVHGKGFFVGICRGHQLGAIADGHQLYQDLKKDGLVDHDSHKYKDHMLEWDKKAITILKLKSKHLKTAVNSFHHQAVLFSPTADSKPIAWSRDGVIEALIQKNNAGISFQFHPEYMLSPESPKTQVQLAEYLFSRVNEMALSKYRSPQAIKPVSRSLNRCNRVYAH